MASVPATRIVVITAPERMDHEWITRLAGEPNIARVERVGVIKAGMELIQQIRPDLVIIDRDIEQAESCARQIFTTLPATQCIAMIARPDVAAIRRLVTAGARDVLGRPTSYSELLASVKTVLATEADRRSRTLLTAGDDKHPYTNGKLVVVISPKGGTGTTTIATNLAVALRQMSAGRVVLADFGLQFGDVGVQLNIWSKHTIHDLLTHVDEIDDAMLAPVLQQHTSGVQVLLAPNTPEAAGDINSDQIETLLDRLLERQTYVVADTWSFLDDVSSTLLRRANEVLVVTTPEIPSLKNVKHFLEYTRQEQMIEGRVTLVLNRFPSINGISLEDVQQHLRHSIGANIPSEGQLVTHSVNRGIPVLVSHPDSWVAQSFMKLAAHIAGEQISALSLAPEQRKSRNKGADGAKGRWSLFGRRAPST